MVEPRELATSLRPAAHWPVATGLLVALERVSGLWGGVRRRLLLAALAVAVVLTALALALYEGDVPELAGDMVEALPKLSPLAPFFLLFIEEAGVPILMPGDVLIMYVAHHLPDSAGWWAAAWVGFTLCSTAGASVLYFIARRWGRPLVAGPLGKVLHLTPERLARAEQWFVRWGPWTVVFGRHIFGFRVPVTVAAGLFGVRFEVFVASVAASAVVWVGFFLLVGATLGEPVARFLEAHRGLTVALPLAMVVVVVMVVGRRLVWR